MKNLNLISQGACISNHTSNSSIYKSHLQSSFRKCYCSNCMTHLQPRFNRITHSFAFTYNIWSIIPTYDTITQHRYSGIGPKNSMAFWNPSTLHHLLGNTLVQPFNINIVLSATAAPISLCLKALFICWKLCYTPNFDNHSSIKQNALLREEPDKLEPRVNIQVTWKPLETVEHIQQSIIIVHCPWKV